MKTSAPSSQYSERAARETVPQEYTNPCIISKYAYD